MYIEKPHLHINIDGVDARNAKMNPDLVTSEHVTGQLPLRDLRVGWVEELCQTPVLDHSLRHGHLAIRRVLDDGEHLPKLGQVPVVGREVVDVEGFGMERFEGDVRRVEPVAVDHVGLDGAAVQEMPGLSRGVRRKIFDQAISFTFS